VPFAKKKKRGKAPQTQRRKSVAHAKNKPRATRRGAGDHFRRLALGLPGVIESSHFGNPDFRVGGKIFATLSLESQGFGVLCLTPEQQTGMVADEPELFSPVAGGWGVKGATRVNLADVPADILQSALRLAWQRRAVKR
jgi:hypothetical protein